MAELGTNSSPSELGDAGGDRLADEGGSEEVGPEALAPPALDADGLQLITRALVGALLEGGDLLLERLRDTQREIDQSPDLKRRPKGLDEAADADLFRYFLVGSLVWGERKTAGFVIDGYRFSRGVAGSFFGVLNRVTGVRALQPLRWRADALRDELARAISLRIIEGSYEEHYGRLLAPGAAAEIVDIVIDFVADNPSLAGLIRTQLTMQSAGLADEVSGSARDLSYSADNLIEAIFRRILRRRPRRDLPPSPLEGIPQVMYAPTAVGGDEAKPGVEVKP